MAPSRQREEHIIQVRGLRNGFGEQIVHDGLDLDVRRGEILGVVGGSGTGKSVLMRSIIGLQPPLAGEVTVFGEQTLDRDERCLDRQRRGGGQRMRSSCAILARTCRTWPVTRWSLM